MLVQYQPALHEVEMKYEKEVTVLLKIWKHQKQGKHKKGWYISLVRTDISYYIEFKNPMVNTFVSRHPLWLKVYFCGAEIILSCISNLKSIFLPASSKVFLVNFNGHWMCITILRIMAQYEGNMLNDNYLANGLILRQRKIRHVIFQTNK